MTARGRGRPPKMETLVARAVVEAMKAPPPTKTFKAKYDAAGQGRRMAGWQAPSTGPNRAMQGLQTIRNRARDSSRNDWPGESAIQKWTTHLVGVGITPRFTRVAKTRKQDIVDLWHDFAARADADCVNSIYGMQTLVVRSWLDSGEVFARRRPRFDDEGLPVPVQVQLLEADMVPMLDTDVREGLPAGNVIRSGIELNKRGRRVAYWVYKDHPGDATVSYSDGTELIRVAASDMCHVFEQKRPGQLRGVSMLAPVLARLRNIENYDDATLTRQQLANMVVAFITHAASPLASDADFDPLTGQRIAEDSPQGPLLGLQPGLIQELGEGEDVKWSNPPEAGTNYPDYMRTQHMGTSAAAGLPYELHAGDIKEVSDRTLRVLINEFRRFGEQRQWQIVIPMFCQRVVEWFVDAAALVGKIDMSEVDAARRVDHAPHGWAYIHPVQDPQGKKMEVDAGFRSRSSVIGERGDDAEAVDRETQADDQRQQDMKIGPYSEATKAEGGAKPKEGDDDGIDNNEYPAPAPTAPGARLHAVQMALAGKLSTIHV